MFYILCSTVLLLLFFCRNKLKDYWTYLFVALSMPLIIIFQANYDSFHNFLSIPDWKFVVIGIIGLLFIGTKLVAKGSGFETSVLTLLLLLGSILVVVSEHLIIIYLAIELQTFCVFILIAKNRDSLKGAEAALKYFILGAISSGVLLLGVSLLLAESSLLTLEALRSDWLSSSILLQVGAALITLSLVFKLAAAPLHFWIPDIYEGSSWDTIAIVSTITKISVIVVLQQIGFDNNFLIGVILLSLIVGTFGALNQTKLKRLLGYSGVNHMGFILIGLLILGVHGYESTHSYLVIYFASMFTILGLSSVKEELKDIFLVELGLYHNTNKILAFSWGLIFLSIAGIPPLSGFLSKWLMILLLADNGYLVTLFVALVVSAIGAGYYLRVVKINYFQKQSSYMVWEYVLLEKAPIKSGLSILLGITVYASLFLILNPQPLFSIFLVNYSIM